MNGILEAIPAIVATLILVLGVPVRFKYVWQGTKIGRRKSARDVSRKFYLASWVIYVLQVIHCSIRGDVVNIIFWSVGTFTVAFCIIQCYRYWHVKMPFGKWVVDSFKGEEEGSWWR